MVPTKTFDWCCTKDGHRYETTQLTLSRFNSLGGRILITPDDLALVFAEIYELPWEDWWTAEIQPFDLQKEGTRCLGADGQEALSVWLVTGHRPALYRAYHCFAAIMREKREARIKRDREQGAGYVYVIKAGPRYKIGRASNLDSRIQQHQTSSPYFVEVVRDAYVMDYVLTERNLHERLASKRVKGEWFELDDADMIAIDALLSERRMS